MICANKWEEIIARKPQKYELRSDGTFVFQLETGEQAKLTCNECGSTVWCVCHRLGKEGINFLMYCHTCGKSARNISITSPRKL